MRTCRRCGLTKPLSEFARRYSRHVSDQRIHQCRVCRNTEAKGWRETHPETARAAATNWYRRNQERVRLGRPAQAQVNYAIRKGLLVRPERCEACGVAGRIEAAHRDYDKPLDVRWLCLSCHRRWDHWQPKTLRREEAMAA